MRVWTLDVSKFRDVKLQINSSRTYMASLDKFKDVDVFHSAILPISLDIFVFPLSYSIIISYSGPLPTLEELKCFLKDIAPEDNWAPLKSMSAISILKKTISQRKIKSNATLSTSNGENIEDITMDSGSSRKRIINSMFASENSLEVRGGTDITLDALSAYLKYLEGTGNASWQEYVSPTNFVLQLNSHQGLCLSFYSCNRVIGINVLYEFLVSFHI